MENMNFFFFFSIFCRLFNTAENHIKIIRHYKLDFKENFDIFFNSSLRSF